MSAAAAVEHAAAPAAIHTAPRRPADVAGSPASSLSDGDRTPTAARLSRNLLQRADPSSPADDEPPTPGPPKRAQGGAPPRVDSKLMMDMFAAEQAASAVQAAVPPPPDAAGALDSLMGDLEKAFGRRDSTDPPLLDLDRLIISALPADKEESPLTASASFGPLQSTGSRASNDSSSSSRTRNESGPPSPVPSHPETSTLASAGDSASVTTYQLLSTPLNKHLSNVENDVISLPSRYSDCSYDAHSVAASTNSISSESGISNDSGSQEEIAVKFPPLGDLKPETLELYRQNAKRSNDPAVQLEFAKYLFVAAEAAKEAEDRLPSSPTLPPSEKRTSTLLHAEALRWLKRLAHHASLASAPAFFNRPPHAEAQFLLAELYSKGSGVEQDAEKAFALYVQATKQAHPAASMKTAWCYETGSGTKKDPARAVFHYRKAAMLGDPFAMYKIGTILLQGRLGAKQNPREGVLWLKRAAQPVASRSSAESPNALFELAQLHDGTSRACAPADLQGIVIQDDAYAYALYLRAAELGYPPAQHHLGAAYEHGLLGLPVDPALSVRFYASAAEKGHPEAELAMSGWYLTGAEGVVAQSDAEAYRWARRAADKGLGKAEYAVGYYTENGVGVEADAQAALGWYQRAAAKGNKRAAAKAAELSQGRPPEKGLLGKLVPGKNRKGAMSFLSKSSSNTSLSTMSSG
ncbi:hypothetical protein DFJ74DRAFT_667734 [Hyaloraphidium curvatum]|nr:hypothetical protein DFJ74DRAFT_667734 [Hyaloraphidium curvatum]